ncbi:MAG: hypothetical protein ACTHQM_02045 [Thermoanaerobaculia bacterium]
MATDDEVKRILDEHADALANLPNVVGMGVVDDAVAVYVSTKVPEERLAQTDIVPKELSAQGVKARTRVIEIGTIKPQ